MSELPVWPRALRAALDAPPLARRSWSWAIAPQLIALFLWVAYFDQLPEETVTRGGIGWTVLGAVVAGVLCNLLLFRAPAMWGMSTGRPLAVTSTSTFGVSGATWVPGLLIAFAQVFWMAVSSQYATALTLRGLVLMSLLDPAYLSPMALGGWVVPGRLFLVTALLWCLAASLIGRYLVRVIAALMNVFPIAPAAVLSLTTVLAFRTLPDFRPIAAAAGVASPGMEAGLFAFSTMVQMVFGFFATAGLLAADWGMVCRNANDVRLGGWVGVSAASAVVATLSILTVAGAAARYGPVQSTGGIGIEAFRYTSALETLTGGNWVAGAFLIVFGLAALAPAVYAAFLISSRCHETFPRVTRTRWTLIGVGLAWLIVLSGYAGRLYELFSLLGGLLAPAAGAMAADYVRSRGRWPGPRRGVNPPGIIAWSLGAMLGLLPGFGRTQGITVLANLRPAAVYAFALAFVTYWLVARLGRESASAGPLEVIPPTPQTSLRNPTEPERSPSAQTS